MDQFKLWGQIQEISTGRYLVIATSCPVSSGRQTSFSTVVTEANEARHLLGRYLEKLESHVVASGGKVVSVNRLPLNAPDEARAALASPMPRAEPGHDRSERRT